MNSGRNEDSKSHHVNAIPSPRLMQTIGATALSTKAAVAELVANSIDARLEACLVNIRVNLLDGRIEIVDDGRGMSLEVLSEALRLGVDMSKVSPTRLGRMGTYGLGMKTAAASLGDRWGIITRPSSDGGGVEYRVSFDLKQWAARSSASDEWSIEIVESEPDLEGPLGRSPHGTVVWIEHLRYKDHLPGPHLEHLGKAFAPYIKNGHQILVGDQKAAVPEPRLVEGSRHEFEVLVDEQRGWKIKGWLGLDVKTHNDDFFGVDLYRRDQLVEIYNKDFFTVHLMSSRILGEAHLDFVPVNFNKVDFSKGTEEWKHARSTMRELLKPLVRASYAMSRNKRDDSRVTKAVTKLQQVLGANPETSLSSVETGVSGGTNLDETSAVVVEPIRLRASGRNIWLQRGVVQIDAQVGELEYEITPWDYIYEPDANQLLVVINPASETFKRLRDVDFLACIAVSNCIARFLIEREMIDPSKARRVSNEWLHEAVTGAPLWDAEQDSSGAGDPAQ